ncbi:MAG: LamG-like jellyroll fold domain-containing protein, partial [Bacteroidota bacterium]
TDQSLLEFTEGFSVDGLDLGFHKITFRFKNEEGNWSHNESSLFFLTNALAQEQATPITKGEYFFDSDDLGPGLNNPVSISPDDGNAEQTLLLFQEGFSVSELPQGFHKITFRFQNESGAWSHNESSLFFVTANTADNVATAITEGEYFFDGFDLGVGNNESVTGFDTDQLVLSFTDIRSTAGLAPGQHTITYRFRNADGSWSHNETDTFEVSGSDYPILPGSGLALEIAGSTRLEGTNSQFTGDDFTIEAWVKWTAGEVRIFSNRGGSPGGLAVEVEEDGSLDVIYQSAPENVDNFRPGLTLPQNQWAHVAVTFSSDPGVAFGVVIRAFLNGIEGPNIEANVPYDPGNSTFQIGGKSSDQDFEIDELRIWKNVRSDDDIRDGLARKYTDNDLINMWHYFRFDDEEGNEVVDLVTGESLTLASGSVNRIRSGAALGDRSVHTYGGSALNFDNPEFAEFFAIIQEGSASGFHIYEINSAPDPFVAPSGFGALNFERYYGHFLVEPENVELRVRYEYGGTNFADNVDEDDMGLARRDDNSFIDFVNADAALNTIQGELVATTLKTQSEWILGDRGSASNLIEGETIDNPILVTGFPFNQSGSLTLYADDFNGPDNQPSADVFYRFTVPECTDEITISLCNSLFDSYLHLLDANGNSVTSTSTGCPDANDAFISTRDLVSGSTYFVVVEADGNMTGNYVLSVEQTEIPQDLVPDEICVPAGITSQELAVLDVGLDANFTWTGPGVSTNGRSVTVTNSGTYQVRYSSGTCSIIDQVTVFFDTTPGTLTGDELIRPEQQVELEYLRSPIGNIALESFDGTDWLPVSNPTIIETSSSYLLRLPALPDGSFATYRIAHTFGTCATVISNELTVSSAAFKGDNLENPIVVNALPFSTTGTNSSTAEGTYTDSFGVNLGGQTSPDVFYQFTAPLCAEQITVATCGSVDFNSFLAVLNASGALITTDDNTCEDDASITFDVMPLQTYFVVVEGIDASVGDYSLSITSIDFEVDLGADISICPGQEATIGAEMDGVSAYLWSTGETTPTITTSTPGTYSVQVTTADGCIKTDEIDVLLEQEITPTPPPFYFEPADGAAGLEFPINFFWIPGTGAATYNLHLWPQGTIPPTEPFRSGITTNQTEVGDSLELGTVYQWRIEAVNICGTQSAFGPTWSFKTGDRPDLQIPSISFDPSFRLPGEDLGVSWAFFNAGLEDAVDVTITAQVYLSGNTTIENDQDILLQSLVFEDSAISAQSLLPIDTSFTIPSNTLAGDYFILVTFTSDIDELNVSNNFKASDFQVEIGALPAPDIVLKDLAYQSAAETGDQIRINYLLENIGTEDIDEIFEDRVYLSPSPTFNLSDATILATNENSEQITVSLTGTILDPPIQGYRLLAGEEKPADFFVNIPTFLSPGDYYLHVQGDIFNDIDEANETNNQTSGQSIAISAPLLPDLAAVSISPSDTVVSGGNLLPISWSVTNISEGVPNVNSWVDAIYLSTQADCSDLTSCGTLLGKFGHSE